MSASRHTYAVVVPGVTNDALRREPLAGILFDPSREFGFAVYGSKKAAEEYRDHMSTVYSEIPYEVVQLR